MGIRRGSISTPIIADGLVFNMDAANRACYPKTGTVTKNTLNTSQTGSLLNGVTFESNNEGVFGFDGTSDIIQFQPGDFNFGTNPWSVGIWIYPTSLVSTFSPLWNLAGYSANNGFALYSRSNLSRVLHLYKSGNTGNVYSIAPRLNEWNYVVITKTNSTTAIAYIYNTTDGTLTDTLTSLTGNWGNSSEATYLGRSTPSSGDDIDGDIGPFHVYNRALSANEVLHNYNALKGRFGL